MQRHIVRSSGNLVVSGASADVSLACYIICEGLEESDYDTTVCHVQLCEALRC